MAKHRTGVEDEIAASPLLRRMFDVEGLVSTLKDHPYGATLLLDLHSLAVLDATWPCSVEPSHASAVS
jgi:hypothetical protein